MVIQKTLRIVFVVSNITISRGGVERVGADMASAMAQRGHTVAIFAKESANKVPVFTIHSSVQVIHYPAGLTSNTADKVRTQIEEFNPDVCIAHFSWQEAFLWPVVLRGTGIQRWSPLIGQQIVIS